METSNNIPNWELRIEHLNCFGDLRLKLLECCYNRQSILERYVAGNLEIHVHGIVGETQFCFTCTANIKGCFENGEVPVLVWIRDAGKGFCPVASVARLKLLDHFDMALIETPEIDDVFPWVINCTYTLGEHLFTIFDRKLRSMDDLVGIKACQLINNIIKGRTQIIYNLPNQNTTPYWFRERFPLDGMIEIINDGLFRNGLFRITRPERHSKGEQISFKELVGVGLQLFQVFVTPNEPFFRAIQKAHMLYFPHGEKDAKDTQRARDTCACA